MTKQAKRTDPHRPGTIVPAEYEWVLSYHGATTHDGWPVPAFGIDCATDRRKWYDADGAEVGRFARDEDGKLLATHCVNGEHDPDGQCCVIGLATIAKAKFADHGRTCQCSSCGTRFVYGDVWRHVPTGEHVHVGWICAEKYELLTDRSAFELAAARRKQATAAACTRAERAEQCQAFLDAHPGLAEALTTAHHIVSDIAVRFRRSATLSEKQVALVFKLHAEATAPKVCDYCGGAHDLDHCEQRQPVQNTDKRSQVRGRVLATKWVDSMYGGVVKMLVLLEGGSKLWGTAPNSLLKSQDELKGQRVEFMAMVQPSRDDRFFGFFSRPTQALVLS